MMTAQRILVVAPALDGDALAELLELDGYSALVAGPREARLKAKRYRPDIVIADIVYPTIDGLTLLRGLEELEPKPRLIMVSARRATALEQLGVTMLVKPVDLNLLWHTLVGMRPSSPPPALRASA